MNKGDPSLLPGALDDRTSDSPQATSSNESLERTDHYPAAPLANRRKRLTHRPRGQETVIPKATGVSQVNNSPATIDTNVAASGEPPDTPPDAGSHFAGNAPSLRPVVEQLIAIAEQLRQQERSKPAYSSTGSAAGSSAVGAPQVASSLDPCSSRAMPRLRTVNGDEVGPDLAHPMSIQQRRKHYAQMARATYAKRRKRASIFGDPELFGEPGWDILLDLYIAQAEQKPVSVSSACIGSASPPTTGLRWLGVLADQGLVERQHDPDDQRRVLVRLTKKGLGAMDEYFASTTSLHGDRRSADV